MLNVRIDKYNMIDSGDFPSIVEWASEYRISSKHSESIEQ